MSIVQEWQKIMKTNLNPPFSWVLLIENIHIEYVNEA